MPGGCCRGGSSHLQQYEGLHSLHDQQQRGRGGLHLLHSCFRVARGSHTCAASLGQPGHRWPPCHSTGLQPSRLGLQPVICLFLSSDLLMTGLIQTAGLAALIYKLLRPKPYCVVGISSWSLLAFPQWVFLPNPYLQCSQYNTSQLLLSSVKRKKKKKNYAVRRDSKEAHG